MAVAIKECFYYGYGFQNELCSDKKNTAVFGLCNNLNFHGHYIWEAKVIGEILENAGNRTDITHLSVYLIGVQDDLYMTVKSFFNTVFNNSKKIVELQNYLKL